MTIKNIFTIALFLLASTAANAIELPAVGTVEVCFTPGENCTGAIVREINGADHEILLQAYEFTSTPIEKALVSAARRGIRVVTILDKSQRLQRGSKASYLLKAGLPVYIDEQPVIAHNKVIIVDRQTLITGSFNFTRAAQESNAENLLIFHGNKRLVDQYTNNFASRRAASVPY